MSYATTLGPVFLLATVALVGCATEGPYVWAANLPPVADQSDGLIHPRDTVVVSVRDQAAMSGEFVVRDDGGVLLPTIGEVTVSGRTPESVRAELMLRAASLVVHPLVAVSIAKVAPIRVNVIGEVKTPASYELTRDRSVAAALAAAGWLTEFADRDRIFVVRRGGDLRVRFRAREITTLDRAVARFRLSDGDVIIVE